MRYQNLCSAQALNEYLTEEIRKISGKAYLFLDEIQEVSNWEKCINSLRVSFDCDIYITGSNAKLLSGELATYLAGRYVEFVIYPFSFSEWMLMEGQKPKTLSEQESFKQYLTLGGMPFLVNLRFDYESSMQYLRDIYSSVVLKDIIARNAIRDVDMLERILTFMISNIGQPFSASSISKYFKSENRNISPETILNYLKACEDSFLICKVHRNDLVGKKVLTVNDKYYIVDHGIREAKIGKNTKDIHLILENIVYMELIRQGYNVTVGKMGDYEVDFVADKQGKRFYIQVAYLLASEETVNREFGVLLKIPDNFPKYVVTMDEVDMSNAGIIHMNIRDFLLRFPL